MSDIFDEIRSLSAEERELFELLMEQQQQTSAAIVPYNGNDKVLPLSFAQERLWFMHTLQPQSNAYLVPMAFRIKGELDIAAMERAVNALRERHDILRVVCQTVNGNPVQVIQPHLNKALKIYDVSKEQDPQQAAIAIATEEARTPVDIATGPLLRTGLICISSVENIFLFTLNHFAADAWTAHLLVNEVADLYVGFSRGEEIPLEKLPLQYVDFAYWQRKRIADELYDKQLHFWQQQLRDLPAAVDLAVSKPRPEKPVFDGAKYYFDFPPALVEKLRKFHRENHVTLFTVFLSAFKVLLYRYSGQQDIVVGTAVSNRNHKEMEKMAGSFANSLALRTKLQPQQPFVEFLHQVKKTILAAMENQDFPFEKLVQELNIPREVERTPIFQVMYLHHDYTLEEELVIPGFEIERVRIDKAASRFDIMLETVDRRGEVFGWYEYSKAIFDEQTMAKMTEHLFVILEAICDDAQRPTALLPILTTEEKHILHERQNTATSFVQTSFIEMFENQVTETPQAVAIEYKDIKITYEQLNKKANQYAHLLRSEIKSGDHVGICMTHSHDMIVAMLAIHKLGAAYVALETLYPQQHLQSIVSAAEMKTILVQKNHKHHFSEQNIVVCEYNIDLEESCDNLRIKIDRQQTAYVTFTSGSSGKPKGICIAQHSLANFLQAMRLLLKPQQARFSSLTTMAFDIFILENCLPLSCGATVVIATCQCRTNAKLLTEHLAKVDIAQATPASWSMLLNDGWQGQRDLVMISGGEKLPQSIADELHSKGKELWNMYGPSEATVWCSAAKLCEGEPVHIGKAIANTKLHVLDTNLQPVPMGIPGELYISGQCLAQKYLQEPHQANLIDLQGERAYRSGDLVKYTSDGKLLFVGRNDRQVKVRGFRIELSEIEQVLEKHESVERAVVIAMDDNNTSFQQLCAYIQSSQVISAEKLREYVRQKLPAYMTPNYFVLLENIPLTANQKVDYQRLPQPQTTTTIVKKPRKEVEVKLLELWQEILQVDKISIEDNFFELGGHSLLGARLVSTIQETFQVQLPLYSIFQNATIMDQGAKIEELLSQVENTVEMEPICAHNRQMYPLSSIQKQMWFLHQVQPQSASYNALYVQKLQGNVNVESLRQAVQLLGERQVILRAVIDVDRDGDPQQVITNHQLKLHYVEVTPDEVDKHVNIATQTPFVLNTFPLARFHLIKYAEQQYMFCFVAHHIICDYSSKTIVSNELTELYNSIEENRTPQLPQLFVNYGDFAVWQRKRDMLEARNYWINRCQDIPVLHIPTDRERPQQQTFRGCLYVADAPQGLEQKLLDIAQRNKSSLFMVVFAGFNILLSRYSGQDDIVIGFPAANRHYDELDHNIGPFINNLVLRTDLSAQPTFGELLQQVNQTLLDAYKHQDYPFESLVEDLNPVRDTSRNPLFQIFINMLDFDDIESGVPWKNIKMQEVHHETFTTRFDITLYIQSRDNLQFTWCYNTDLFSESTIRAMNECFIRLLENIVQAPQTKIHLLSVADNATVSPVLFADLPYETTTVLDMWKKTVSQVPHKTALWANDLQYNYTQLDEQSARVCAMLQSKNIGRENTVVLASSHHVDMVAALLGILKSGATCIPLQPEFFTSKTVEIVEDASLVLCQKSLCDQFSTQQTIAIEEAITYSETPAQQVDIHEEDTAFIIYTSGSTGAANGVILTHKNIASKVQTIAKSLDINSDDTCILTASISFVASIRQILVPLIYKATLVIVDRDILRDPQRLFQEMAAKKISVVDFVPSYCATCAQELFAMKDRVDLRHLRQITASGEKLAIDTVMLWRKLIPGVRFLNVYGQTETTGAITLYEIPQKIDHTLRNIPVGRAVGCNQIYILDKRLQPVPKGAIGEICVVSNEVAHGYQNATLAKEKFVGNPFAAGVIYRTGDRGRWNNEQQLQVIARTDQLVKVHGYRVDPLEIEVILRKYPQIRNAAVVFCDNMLKAYITTKHVESKHLVHEEIRQYLHKHLPEYMIPQKIFAISHLPTTTSGKTDYLALEDFDHRFLYSPVWKPSKDLAKSNAQNAYLLFADQDTNGQHASMIIVRESEQFSVHENNIAMDFANREHYTQLISHLQHIGFDFKNVVYSHHNAAYFTRFVQAFDDYMKQMLIVIVCRNVFPVITPKKLQPQNALIVGTARVLPLEYPGLKYACIECQDVALCDTIFDELHNGLPDENVAYINGQRYTMDFEHLVHSEANIIDGQAFLITGGLGNIGLHIAVALAQRAKVKIALTTRNKENISPKVDRMLSEMSALGAHVAIFETDLQDKGELVSIIAQINQQWGNIHGVINCAGARGHFGTLNKQEQQREVVRCKGDRAQFVIDVLKETSRPAFFIACSSLSSILGRYGQAQYAAENAYLDCVLQQNSQESFPIISVNWDVWRELPTLVAEDMNEDMAELIHFDTQKGISNEQGICALLALPNVKNRQVVVSKRAKVTGVEIHELIAKNDFVAPSTSLEKKMATIWCSTLQLDKISLHDNFFHVGGHSLLAIALMEKVRKLVVDVKGPDHEHLPLSILLTHPTIRQLCEAIECLDSALEEQVIQVNSTVENKPAIFLVHAPNIDPICYQHMTKYLDGAFTTYVIRSDQLHSHTTIKDTAKYHIEKMKSVQKEGPYVIGGMCMGGLVALEVGQQLLERGDEVLLTFMMDTINIPGMDHYKSRELHNENKRKKQSRVNKWLYAGKRLVAGDFKFIATKIVKIKDNAVNSIRKRFDADSNKVFKEMRDRLRLIRDEYQPQEYTGDLLYIRSQKQKGDFAEEHLQKLTTGKFYCHQIPGSIHSDVVRPLFARATAECLKEHL